MSALHELDAATAAALIAARQISSVELTEHLLARIERLDPGLDAFVTVTPDLALGQARAADDAVARQRGRGLGPLHGVPIAVKDNLDVEDVVTTWGSRTRTEAAPGDDHVVARLRDAHLPIVGKTHLPEFALPCHGRNPLGGDTRNPWDERLTPGGSSSGSAAAVSAGLAPLGLGTDAGGSVRIPASCCGLVGIRPSNGRVSPGPGDQSPTGLSSPGVLARTPRDATLLLDVISGSGPGDLTAARQGRAVPEVLRIGVATAPMVPDVEIHPGCVAAVTAVADALASDGHQVTAVDLGQDLEVTAAFRDAWSVVAASFEVDDEDELDPFTRHLRAHGGDISGVRLHDALTLFRGVAMMLDEIVFGDLDVLVTPTLASPPVARDAFTAGADEERNFASMTRFMPFTPMYNIAGMPSVSVPGNVVNGIPVGVLVGAPHGSDGLLLRLAERLVPAAASRLAPGWGAR